MGRVEGLPLVQRLAMVVAAVSCASMLGLVVPLRCLSALSAVLAGWQLVGALLVAIAAVATVAARRSPLGPRAIAPVRVAWLAYAIGAWPAGTLATSLGAPARLVAFVLVAWFPCLLAVELVARRLAAARAPA